MCAWCALERHMKRSVESGPTHVTSLNTHHLWKTLRKY